MFTIKTIYRFNSFTIIAGLLACVINFFRLLYISRSHGIEHPEQNCSFIGLGLMILMISFAYLAAILLINVLAKSTTTSKWGNRISVFVLLLLGSLPALYIIYASSALR